SNLPVALACPAPAISPVSISRFGTESARAPSVSTRLRLSSNVSVPSAAARISTSPIQTACASSPCSAPLQRTLDLQFGTAWSTNSRCSWCWPESAKCRPRIPTSPPRPSDRVRVVALQRALVEDVGLAVRHRVVDEQPVLLVLAGVGEVQAEHLDVAAGAAERRGRAHPHQVAAERDDDVLEVGVAAELEVLLGHVHRVVGPVLHAHDGQVRTVAEHELD